MLTEKIKEAASGCAAKMTAFRRELHRYPELSNEEYRTAERTAGQRKYYSRLL